MRGKDMFASKKLSVGSDRTAPSRVRRNPQRHRTIKAGHMAYFRPSPNRQHPSFSSLISTPPMALVSAPYLEYNAHDLAYQRSLKRPQAVDPALAQRFPGQSNMKKSGPMVPRIQRQAPSRRASEGAEELADSDIDEGYFADRDHKSRKLRGALCISKT